MNDMAWIVPTALTVIGAMVPLMLAGLGELVAERSGVLNLGVEGMMLVGAVAGFGTTVFVGDGHAGVLASALAGAASACLFGALTIGLLANQVASGLALTLFGIGLSAALGAGFVGMPVDRLPRLDLPGLSDLPVLGPILFGHDILVYIAFLSVPAIHFFLYRSHAGLVLRAVGESPDAARAMGYPVRTIRMAAVAFGGAMAGLGGAYLSLAHTPMWAEGMTAGRGWIALALVVFASWLPGRLAIGAALFGAVTILQFHAQGIGVGIPSQFLSMLPYLATIAVLVVLSSRMGRDRLDAPRSLGRIFDPGH